MWACFRLGGAWATVAAIAMLALSCGSDESGGADARGGKAGDANAARGGAGGAGGAGAKAGNAGEAANNAGVGASNSSGGAGTGAPSGGHANTGGKPGGGNGSVTAGAGGEAAEGGVGGDGGVVHVGGKGGVGGAGGVGGVGGGSNCVSKSCVELFLNCGSALDNCGRALACGSCPAGTTCGASGVANVCAPAPRAPNCREGWCWTHRAAFGGDFGGIAAFAANDVWFVAAHGTLWHWNGSRLEDKSPDGERAWLNDVWGPSAGELWVSARDGVRHYSAGTWSRESFPTLASSEYLRMIWGTGSGANVDVWAATSTTVYRRVAGTWSAVGSFGSSILAGWASSAEDVWVVGGTTSSPFVQHFDGKAWSLVDIGATRGYARAVVGRSATDIFVSAGGALYHYDGVGWSNVAPSIGAEPENLWLAPDGTLWGAGTYGLLRWDGSDWHPEEVPTGIGLSHVRGVGSDLWVTSRLGTVMHRTGSGANATWSRLSGVGTGFSTLERVAGSAADDVWVMPGFHSVMHFDGTRWSSIADTSNCSYNDIWVGARGRPWLVGAKLSPDTGTCVNEWNGSTWVDHASGLDPSLGLRAIWGLNDTDLWIGGSSGTNRLFHYDGQAWTGYAASMPILDISGSASNRVVAVGVATDKDELRFDGTKWTAYASNLFPTLLTPHFVNGVWVAPNGAIWLASEDGMVGTSAGREQTVSTLDLAGIHGAGNKVWAIEGGAYGRVLERSGNWRAIETPRRRSLSGLWAAAENDAWFIGTGGLIHYDGQRYSDTDGIAFWSVSQFSLVNDNDVWAAAGDYVLHWDGGDWLEHFAASSTISAVAAVDSTHVYAGSGIEDSGALYFWNGQVWKEIWSSAWWSVRTLFAFGPNDVWFAGKGSNAADKIAHYDGKAVLNAFDGPISGGFSALWGSSGTDLWAGGDAGSLVHFDGVSWEKRTSPTSRTISLWGAAANDLWLVGAGSCELYRFNGADFIPQTIPACDGASFKQVWGRDANDVWFVGGDSAGGRLLHFNGSAFDWVEVPYSSQLASVAASASSVWVGASWDVLRMRR